MLSGILGPLLVSLTFSFIPAALGIISYALLFQPLTLVQAAGVWLAAAAVYSAALILKVMSKQ